MEGLYDDPQANMTLLVPRDDKLQHIPDEVLLIWTKGQPVASLNVLH